MISWGEEQVRKRERREGKLEWYDGQSVFFGLLGRFLIKRDEERYKQEGVFDKR